MSTVICLPGTPACAQALAPFPRASLRAALRELWKAHACAEEFGQSPWEFAVTLEGLCHLGLTETDLRWLVRMDYALHAVEGTGPGDVARVLRRAPNLALAAASCFVLTAAGVELARQLDGEATGTAGKGTGAAPEAPRWEAAAHTLWWRARVVKCFRGDAPYQEAVLGAFQTEGWPGCVAFCLPRDDGADAKQRLRDAVRNLNRGVRPHLHFCQEGSGSRLRWQALEADAATGATQTRPKRDR